MGNTALGVTQSIGKADATLNYIGSYFVAASIICMAVLFIYFGYKGNTCVEGAEPDPDVPCGKTNYPVLIMGFVLIGIAFATVYFSKFWMDLTKKSPGAATIAGVGTEVDMISGALNAFT